jgi:MazG family protein
MSQEQAGEAFAEFVRVVKALRTPGTGCPWDLEQTHLTLRPFLVDETYEVLDALDAGQDGPLCEELGDLLLQIVLHAQLAADRAAFNITDVLNGITTKMIRRHPHVFGDEKMANAGEVMRHWERAKAAERSEEDASPAAKLERLPSGLPALAKAQRLGEKAARFHTDGSTEDALQQARSQLDALEAMAGTADRDALDRELGDLLFTLCQVARKLDIHAEDSLRASGRRFVERFQ